MTWHGLTTTLVLLGLFLAGCTRAQYRRQADRDAYGLVNEKTGDPRWTLPRVDIDADPHSRMFDPFSPDRPPLPPDDPASHALMHRVDGKKGYPRWHANGDTTDVQNPGWEAWLPLNEDGVLVLDDRRAVQLALLHSPEYQRLLEELYLSALDVSFERFRFDTQFFGGYAADYAAEGSSSSASGAYEQVLAFATHNGKAVDSGRVRGGGVGWDAHRAFATGSELMVGFANSVMWQFSGSGSNFTPTTVLDFSLVQPLLRYAGRDRVLERLTLAERTLLANVRQMERYRQGFYLQIMTGRDPGQGPARRGGVFGGAGLEGFTGIGGSGFGRVTGGAASGGGISGGGTGAGQAGGLLGLLQVQQEIFNQEDNLYSLRSNYFQLLFNMQELLKKGRGNTEAVVRQRLQVAQSRQAILNAESRLVNAQANFLVSLDRFKLLLGLPPQVCVRVDERMLEPVKLLDPAMLPIRKAVSELQLKVGDHILAILPQGDETTISWTAEVADQLRRLRQLLDEVEQTSRLLTDGEAAQVRRVRTDGLKLGRVLRDAIQQAASRAEPTATDPWAEDLNLLRQILDSAERDDRWAEELRQWNQLEDTVHDRQQLRNELERAALPEARTLDISWMATDANAQTRRWYEQYRPAVDAWNVAPADQRAGLLQSLRDRVHQESQSFLDDHQQQRERQTWLARLGQWRTRPYEDEADVTKPAVEIRRLKRLFVQFADAYAETPEQFDALPDRIRAFQAGIDGLLKDGPTLTPEELTERFNRDISPAIPQELVNLANDVLELSLVQARDRAETVALTQVDLHPDAGLEIARVHRLDWMNARGALVDTWRLIQFNADALKSGLDVVFSGDISNSPDHAFRLDPATGRVRVGLAFDAPLTRLAERNNYRQALIEYQQARRSYYRYEDSVARSLREILRTIDANQANFEIRRNAVRVADLQIELNDAIRRTLDATGQPAGPTAARDAVSALSDLLTAQNDFLSVWISYEVLRRALDFDLGTLRLDSDGVWVDPGPLTPQQGYPGIRDAGDCWPGKMVLPDVPPELLGTPVPEAESPAEARPGGEHSDQPLPAPAGQAS